MTLSPLTPAQEIGATLTEMIGDCAPIIRAMSEAQYERNLATIAAGWENYERVEDSKSAD